MDFESASGFVKDQIDIARRRARLFRRLGAFTAEVEKDPRTPEERFQELGDRIANLPGIDGKLHKFMSYQPEAPYASSPNLRVTLRAQYEPHPSNPDERGRVYQIDAHWRSDLGNLSREELSAESPSDLQDTREQTRQLNLLTQTVAALEKRLGPDTSR